MSSNSRRPTPPQTPSRVRELSQHFDSLASEDGVTPSSPSPRTPIYTGENRVPIRERLRRIRDRAAGRRGTTRNPPRTPSPQIAGELACPGAPSKKRDPRLQRVSDGNSSSSEEDDVLLDRRANSRPDAAVSRKLFVDVANERRQSGDTEPGRASPLRNSISADEMSELMAGFEALRKRDREREEEEEGEGRRKTARLADRPLGELIAMVDDARDEWSSEGGREE
ncbi:hypothetical protein F4779DRAFT_377760 [Xylariaceae sp. FL0662B]|nr:hypothetical protein F4779DRAFT_377760 [Xylariaceae sp. FL0662B]